MPDTTPAPLREQVARALARPLSWERLLHVERLVYLDAADAALAVVLANLPEQNKRVGLYPEDTAYLDGWNNALETVLEGLS